MLEEAADDISLSCPEQTLSLKTCRKRGGGGEARERGRVRDWGLLKEATLLPTVHYHAAEPGGETSPRPGGRG